MLPVVSGSWVLVALGILPGDLPCQKEGPRAALEFAASFRGGAVQDAVLRYPDARGIPFEATQNIVPMTERSWQPVDLASDFRQRYFAEPGVSEKRGILVVLKTERCSTKWARACSITTAALEKRVTPLIDRFEGHGVWLKPRDGDDPPGSLGIERGGNAWKNSAAGVYGFVQGPGATIVALDPRTGRFVERSDAITLGLYEEEFVRNGGKSPKLEAFLARVLREIERS